MEGLEKMLNSKSKFEIPKEMSPTKFIEAQSQPKRESKQETEKKIQHRQGILKGGE